MSAIDCLNLIDIANAPRFGNLPADKRVQIKMPSSVVAALDKLFPKTDRSRLLTQLALQAISQKLRFSNRPDLYFVSQTEQNNLDSAWNYLEGRDAGAEN